MFCPMIEMPLEGDEGRTEHVLKMFLSTNQYVYMYVCSQKELTCLSHHFTVHMLYIYWSSAMMSTIWHQVQVSNMLQIYN